MLTIDKITEKIANEIVDELIKNGIVRFELNDYNTFLKGGTVKVTSNGNWCTCVFQTYGVSSDTLFEYNLFTDIKTLYSAFMESPTLNILLETIKNRRLQILY